MFVRTGIAFRNIVCSTASIAKSNFAHHIMNSFTLPNTTPPVRVRLPPNLSQDQLLSFPAFKNWLTTLQHSLSLQHNRGHAFYQEPYALRKIEVQAVDFFGNGKVGFIKLSAEVANEKGEKLPGCVFMRGGSVGILVVLEPSNVDTTSASEKYALLTIQPRVAAGALAFAEIPAGMIDDSGSFSGRAAQEIKEETGLSIREDELVNMTELAIPPSADESKETLQRAMYPSPGGSDEFIPLFLCEKRMEQAKIQELAGKLTGLRDEGEKITLKLVKLDRLWREGARDAKTLAAWALYDGLKRQGRL